MRAGTVVGQRYRVERPLARGGMSEVFLAKGLEFPRMVVIKVLRQELLEDEVARSYFHSECRIGAELSHPNIVQVLDLGEVDNTPYMVMEHIQGEELNALCGRGLSLGRFLSRANSVELVRQLACALGHTHARRRDGESLAIVHRDVSPNNILISEDGYAKLIDFGIATWSQSRGPEAFPGKVAYMSPEQAAGEPVDFRSDVFSLGIVLYELTLGRRLFRGAAADVLPRVVGADITPPTFVDQDYPGHLEGIVMRALERHPADRHHSSFDLADELGDFLRTTGEAGGCLPVARYLDELAVAVGGQRRPELVPEHEWNRDEEALDFERELFSNFEPVSAEAAERALEWQDLEEGEAAVAGALGVPVSQISGVAAKIQFEAEPERSGDAELDNPSEAELDAPPDTAAREERPSSAARPETDSSFGLILAMVVLLLVAGALWVVMR